MTPIATVWLIAIPSILVCAGLITLIGTALTAPEHPREIATTDQVLHFIRATDVDFEVDDFTVVLPTQGRRVHSHRGDHSMWHDDLNPYDSSPSGRRAYGRLRVAVPADWRPAVGARRIELLAGAR